MKAGSAARRMEKVTMSMSDAARHTAAVVRMMVRLIISAVCAESYNLFHIKRLRFARSADIIEKEFKPESKGSPDGKGEIHDSLQVKERHLLFALARKGGLFMSETRLAVVSIIVEDTDCSDRLNALLHEFGEYIVGRMGIPYRAKGVSVLAVVIDAPQEKINALTGRMGMLGGVTAKTLFSKY